MKNKLIAKLLNCFIATMEKNNLTMQQCNNRKSQKGFVLLELLMVIVIIGVVSAFGGSTFVEYYRTQQLKSAANDLASMLNTAKSNALSQLISFPATNCLNKRLDGYEVVIVLATNKYRINVVCAGDQYQILEKTLPDNIVFLPVSQTSFFFPVLTNGVVGFGTVQLSGYGQTRDITVTNTGVIK